MNFFLADVRGGLGAFVSVFLVTAAGWSAAEIGQILTVSGLIGIMLHAPVGAAIDSLQAKRALLVAGVILLAVCAIAIERRPTGPIVFTADVTMAVLGGIFAPTVAALTLGLFATPALPARFARNAAFDRAGNITIAVLVGLVGWIWTQHTTFYLIPAFAALSIVFILAIPADAIDHDRARGFTPHDASHRPQQVLSLFSNNRPLVVLAALAAVFNFANGAMLPLIGQKLALAHPGYESALTSACILLAQIVTIPVAIVIGRNADRWSLKTILYVACGTLALRGAIFAATDNVTVLVAAQVLDGVSYGIWDVLFPLMLAGYISGSGRYSFSRGVLGTIQGFGGSISNVVAGELATNAS